MVTLAETSSSAINSSIFTENYLNNISDSLSGMTPISNITIQNDQRSNNKRRSADVTGIKSTAKPVSKLMSGLTISVSSGSSTLKKKPSGSALDDSKNPLPSETYRKNPLSSEAYSGRKASLSLNLFKQGLADHSSSFNVEDNSISSSPASSISLHSEPTSRPSLSIVTDYLNSVQISPHKIPKIVSSNDISDTEKNILDDDEDIDFANDDEINSFLNDPASPSSVRLTPFANQVGGHTSFFRFSRKAVCKPLVNREHHFYETLEHLHPDLLPFVPQYLGVVNVTNRSQSGELLSMPEVVFEQNKHLLPEWMLNSLDKNIGEDHNSDKENYDKGYSDDSNSQGLTTKVNKQLKEEVLYEVFSPKALRARMRQTSGSESCTRRHSMINIPTQEKLDSTLGRSKSLTSNDDISEKSSKKSRPVSLRGNSYIDQVGDVLSNDSLEDCEVDNYYRETKNATPFQQLKVQSVISTNITPQILTESQTIFNTKDTSSIRDSTTDLHRRPSKRRLIETSNEGQETSTQMLSPPLTPNNNWSEKSNNTWSLHCYTTQLSKLQSSNNFGKVQQFVLLEDLTAGLKHPCVLDLKMGTRQYGIDAAPEKRESQMKKCAKTTSKTLGVRVCGMQVYKTTTRKSEFQDKYYGRSLNPHTFKDALKDFIHNGNKLLIHQIPVILRKLRRLAKIIRQLENYRFYASSLLLIYDGDENNPRDIDIRIIDFAHCTTGRDYPHSECKYPPNEGFDRGYLLGLKNLCRSFEAIYRECCGIIPGNVGEEEGDVFSDIYSDNTLGSSRNMYQQDPEFSE